MNQSQVLDRINQRSDGRKAARTACSLIDINDMPPQVKAGFWLEMLNMMPEEFKPPTSPVEHKLDDDEARKFEAERISFGTHEGKRFCDVPISYLTWIADSSNELKAYLSSDRGRKRIEAGE